MEKLRQLLVAFFIANNESEEMVERARSATRDEIVPQIVSVVVEPLSLETSRALLDFVLLLNQEQQPHGRSMAALQAFMGLDPVQKKSVVDRLVAVPSVSVAVPAPVPASNGGTNQQQQLPKKRKPALPHEMVLLDKLRAFAPSTEGFIEHLESTMNPLVKVYDVHKFGHEVLNLAKTVVPDPSWIEKFAPTKPLCCVVSKTCVHPKCFVCSGDILASTGFVPTCSDVFTLTKILEEKDVVIHTAHGLCALVFLIVSSAEFDAGQVDKRAMCPCEWFCDTSTKTGCRILGGGPQTHAPVSLQVAELIGGGEPNKVKF
jgi:hypothetical protein